MLRSLRRAAHRAAPLLLACLTSCAETGTRVATTNDTRKPGQTAASASPAPLVSTNASSARPAEPPDRAFASLEARFLEGYLSREPVAATEAGEHAYDGRWPDRSVEGEAEARRFYAGILDELGRIPAGALDAEANVDREMLETELRYALFAIDDLREAERDPLHYTRLVADGLEPLVTRSFSTPEARLRNLVDRLESVGSLLGAAKKRLQRPPRRSTETAIAHTRQLVSLARSGVLAPYGKLSDQALVGKLARAGEGAARGLEDFERFLEKDLLPRSDGDHRLGRERFTNKLRFYLDDDIDPDELARGARALLERTQDQMAETAKELWPILFTSARKLPKAETRDEKKAMVREVLWSLAWDKPGDGTVTAEARELVRKATQFVRDNDLMRVPTDPCEVVEVPEAHRGVFVAHLDASGPLEDKATMVYAISPPPQDWDIGRKISFWSEYNRSMLADLTAHEVMPGHFLELATGSRARSKLRAVFASGPFVEGWAVYAEWVMAKHGFGGPRVRIQREKMVLRLAVNALLDHGVHAGNMSEADALVLMMGEAFQEESEAVSKWQRALLTSAQLTTYYYGFTEMMKLREANERQPGFSERGFHDRVLSHGAPSMRHLRALVGP